jgi:anti-anti-sigma factor
MPQTYGEWLEWEDKGDVKVVRLKAATVYADAATEDAFQHLFSLVDESGCRKYVLDLSAIQYFASSALGKLVTLTRKARAAEARLVLCNVTPAVERILQVTRLADLMIAYNNESEAVRSFA